MGKKGVSEEAVGKVRDCFINSLSVLKMDGLGSYLRALYFCHSKQPLSEIVQSYPQNCLDGC